MRHQTWRFGASISMPKPQCGLSWLGVMPVNIAAPVKYFGPEAGCVTRFQYGRDNVLLTWMHMRLFAEFLVRLRH